MSASDSSASEPGSGATRRAAAARRGARVGFGELDDAWWQEAKSATIGGRRAGRERERARAEETGSGAAGSSGAEAAEEDALRAGEATGAGARFFHPPHPPPPYCCPYPCPYCTLTPSLPSRFFQHMMREPGKLAAHMRRLDDEKMLALAREARRGTVTTQFGEMPLEVPSPPKAGGPRQGRAPRMTREARRGAGAFQGEAGEGVFADRRVGVERPAAGGALPPAVAPESHRDAPPRGARALRPRRAPRAGLPSPKS